jgi:hypothetical protein
MNCRIRGSNRPFRTMRSVMPKSSATLTSISGKSASGGLIGTRVTRPILSIAAVTSAILCGAA